MPASTSYLKLVATLLATLLAASCASNSITVDLSRTTGLDGTCALSLDLPYVSPDVSDRWGEDVDALVFFEPGVDPEGMAERLESLPSIARAVTNSSQDALDEWHEIFDSEIIEPPEKTKIPRRIDLTAVDGGASGFRLVVKALEFAPDVIAVTDRANLCLSDYLGDLLRCSGTQDPGESLAVGIRIGLSAESHKDVGRRIDAVAADAAIERSRYVSDLAALDEVAAITGVDLFDLGLHSDDVAASFRITTSDPETAMQVLNEEFGLDVEDPYELFGSTWEYPVYRVSEFGSDC